MKKMLLTALLFGATFSEPNKSLESKIIKEPPVIEVSKEAETWCDSIPKVIKYKNLKPGSCSLYVLLAGKELFEKEYTWSDSWDRRYNDKIVKVIDNERPYDETKELIEEKILKPGMVLGVYNPGSRENYKKDSRGKQRKYTHVLLYVGKEKSGDYIFFHNYGKVQERISLNELKRRGFTPKEIIDERD